MVRQLISKLSVDQQTRIVSEGYATAERCYVLRRERLDNNFVEYTIPASPQSPLINPAFRIKNWDTNNIELSVNGHSMNRAKTSGSIGGTQPRAQT